MTLGPAKRTPAEQIELCVQLMPLFDSLDPLVRQALHEVDCDVTDLIILAQMRPEDALRAIQQWKKDDRNSVSYAY